MYQDLRQKLFYAAALTCLIAFWASPEVIQSLAGDDWRGHERVVQEVLFNLTSMYLGYKILNALLFIPYILKAPTHRAMADVALNLSAESMFIDIYFMVFVLLIFEIAEHVFRQETLAEYLVRNVHSLQDSVADYPMDLALLVWQ